MFYSQFFAGNSVVGFAQRRCFPASRVLLSTIHTRRFPSVYERNVSALGNYRDDQRPKYHNPERLEFPSKKYTSFDWSRENCVEWNEPFALPLQRRQQKGYPRKPSEIISINVSDNHCYPFKDILPKERGTCLLNSNFLSVYKNRSLLVFNFSKRIGSGYGTRTIYTSSVLHDPTKTIKSAETLRQEEKSRVEEAVEAIRLKKEETKEKAFQYGCSPEDLVEIQPAVPVVKKSIWEKVKHEALHYYNGFKLLYFEVRISIRLLWRVMNGTSLTRRERRQFLRTAADLFRLVPFLVFLVIPFMEFLLPVAIRLFPNMLPSTFEDKSKKEEKTKKQLRGKIEMAKFLQDTVEEMAVTAKEKKSQGAVVSFSNFFDKIRNKGEQPSNEDILKFSKLFEDEITLDNMSRGQLKAINGLLLLPSIGTNNYLRFQLQMKLRQLRTDDLMIRKEGVDIMTVQEVQSACQARGMRAIGVPEARLRSQLRQWLELHLDEQVPISLLLMSRALYLPENVSTVDKLKETLSKLPDTLVGETEVKVAEVAGELVDNKLRLDILRKEEAMIAEEKEEIRRIKEEDEAAKQKQAAADAAEIIVDHAKTIEVEEEISKEDWLSVKAIANPRDDLEKIKEDRVEYQEDLKELAIEDEEKILMESVGSTRLGKRVDKMITNIEKRLQSLETDLRESPETFRLDADGDGKITTEELISALQTLQNSPSEAKCRKIADMLDQDKDGALDLDDIETVIELLCMEDVDLTPPQISEIVHLIKQENEIKEAAASKAEPEEPKEPETQKQSGQEP